MTARYDLYACDRADRCRYLLGRGGDRLLFTIGLNPSTATREKSDTTVAKVEQVALRHGFDGFAMLNLYPVRATDCSTLPDAVERKVWAENLRRIVEIVSSTEMPVLWAAWGSGIRTRGYFLQAAHELSQRLDGSGARWQHFGPLTAEGHPRHPSRLRYAWNFGDFAIDRYLVRFLNQPSGSSLR
ncbi:DUF1643 domain-containing protein [Pseudoxanthomonas kalamensis]|uniref:DUF1643 domain-containing protein n=1 Tax=Pseudoxanthomonas kalamensis TaxID=289483 RepID=UPI0013913163|nr:DUF1643 domain-containing protein [Pseudoxanthomonas kalamensis]